jgi:hypothetical protein
LVAGHYSSGQCDLSQFFLVLGFGLLVNEIHNETGSEQHHRDQHGDEVVGFGTGFHKSFTGKS